MRGDFAAMEGIGDLIRKMRDDGVNSSEVIKKSKKKELLVFCLYVHVGNQSYTKVQERMSCMHGIMKEFAKDIEEESNYKVSFFVLPQKEAESRLECIFPKDQEELDMSIFNQITEEKLLP